MRQRIAAFVLAFLALAALTARAEAIDIQRVVSPGGIEAWLVEDNAVPVISMSFAFDGGAAQDPADKPGVANMMSGLLDEGASWLDSKTFQTRLDDRSIRLSFDAGRDNFTGSLKTLAENLNEASDLLRLSLRWPRFDPEPVERIRAQILTNIRHDARDPDAVAGQALMQAVFPDHPYGRPVAGTEESVAAITRDDLVAYHDRVIARDNLTIAVVGAIDADRLSRLLDQVFGILPEHAELQPVPETAPVAGKRIDVAMPIPQTVVRLMAPGIKRDDPKFIDAYVAAFVLGGGGFGSRLFDEIREERGLAYSVSLGIGALDHAGLVSGGTSTRTDKAGEVVDLMTGEIARYAGEGPTEKELDDVKSYLIGSYPLRFTTSDRIASQLLYIQLDDLGIDYVDKRNDMIAALTVDDIKAAARRLFAGVEPTVVTVGQPSS